jgi:hypothetical protein
MTCSFRTVAIQSIHRKPIKTFTKMENNPNDNSSRSADQGSDDFQDGKWRAFRVEESLGRSDTDDSSYQSGDVQLTCDPERRAFGSFQAAMSEQQSAGLQKGSNNTPEHASEIMPRTSDPVSIASGPTQEGVDRIPEVKDLKLGRCNRCIKSNTKCIAKGKPGTICERCSKGKHTCEYTYLEPREVTRCDNCINGKRVCPQAKSSRCNDCSSKGINLCVDKPCDRCLRIKATCGWETVTKSRNLRSVWEPNSVVRASEEEGGGEVEEDSLHNACLDSLTSPPSSSGLLT